jgi:hypothetical protein
LRIKEFGIQAAALLAICVLAPCVTRAQTRLQADRVWYVPNPGSLDLLRMFEHPEEWRTAAKLIDVFQFTQQHTFAAPDSTFAPNSYDALVRVDAFRTLMRWGKHIALGVGAVKPFFCTPDASGMQRSLQETLKAVQAIEAAHGTVTYLLMDEPFLSGRAPVCDGPNLPATADRLRPYVTGVRAAFPALQIGLIEAYPSFVPAEFSQMLSSMSDRGIDPAFLQLDIDIRAVPRSGRDLTADLRELKRICEARGVPFGIILWGYNGEADALFAQDLHTLGQAVFKAFPAWSEFPQQFVVESWAVSSTGLAITPANLPETRAHTLTNILLNEYRFFRSATGPPTGIAVPR